jgi:hypothetical protein
MAGAMGTPAPLFVWSPAATESCLTKAASLEEFRKLAPAFEVTGRQLDATPRSIFKSPELGRYQLLQRLPESAGGDVMPPGIRKLLGWNEEDAQSPGAYPFNR